MADIDLTDLRSITDGDKDIELALFAEFYSSSEESIADLQRACNTDNHENWRAIAHALKGTAYNLGAKSLGDLCQHAQAHPNAPPSEKQALLEKIKAEYATAKTYLQRLHP